ncbi:MAG: leucine-rich repeat protein [Lachnospiraceae bacterium]|nr:leucine-rich repeat protein [Lachnospiraceae bacterium]
MGKRVLSVFLCVVLLLSCVDYTVFAAEVAESVQETEQETVTVETVQETESESVTVETEEVEDEPESPLEESSEVVEPEESSTVVEDNDEQDSGTEIEEEQTSLEVEESSLSEFMESEEQCSSQMEQANIVNNGEEATYELIYEINADGTATITGFTGTASGDLVIPNTIDGYKVTGIGGLAFHACDEFEGMLVLPEGLEIIGGHAFLGCSGFTGDLVIPDSVTEILDGAFESCGFTGRLRLSENLEVIRDGAFFDCRNLTGDLIIPEAVTSICDSAFANCGFTGKLVLPMDLTTIGNSAFYDCSGFTGSLVIPEKVTKIGWFAFSGCSGFTGDLSIPEKVVEIGNNAFENCSGFTGKLVLPEGLEKIENCAFRNCSGFTGDLVIPESVSEIGYDAFENCKGFTGKLVLPENLKKIGSAAFRYCSGFTGKLVIPEGITSIEYYTFYWCKGLNDVYLPQSISYIEQYAFECGNSDATMHCYIGSYAYNWAIENGFEVIGIEKASTTPIVADPEKHIIYIYDTESETPITNATISISDKTFQTSSEGLISFPAVDVAIKTKIQVSADGYPVLETVKNIKNGTVTRIGMQPTTENLTVTSVSGELGEEKYDFLNGKLVLGYYADTSKIEKPEQQTLKITAKANKAVTKYEIITEDGTTVMSDANGVFEITTITSGKTAEQNTIKPNMPINSTFEHGKKYYVRVTDNEGNTAKKKIGLSATVNYITAENEYQKGAFKLGESFKIDIPSDVPFIGGSKYKVGFEEALPVEMSVDESGKVKIALNKPADVPLNKFHENYKNLEKKAKRGSDISKAFGKSVSPFGAGFIDVNGKVCGYGEGNISELDKGNLTIKLGIIAEIEGEGGYKYYFFLGSIPVNVFVEGSVKSSFQTEGKVTIENWKIKSLDITGGSINIKIEITVGGGVGVGIELNASGTGNINYLCKPARNYHKAWLEGSLKVVGCVGPFEKTLWKTEKYKYTILEKGKDAAQNLLGVTSSGLTGDTYTESSFTPISRNYLNYSKGYNNNFKTQSLSTNEKTTSKTILREAVYPSASPKMVEVNGSKYLFWLEDITSRNLNNRTALVYSKSPNGISWSEPIQLIKEMEDGTLDNTYDVYIENDKIYVTWQDATRVITEEDDVLSAMKAMSVRLVEFDTQTDTVTENNCLTQDSGYYMYPCTVAAGGESYSAYVHNMLDSEDVLGNNTQHLYCIKGTDSEAKEITLPEKAQIVNMDGGIFEGEASVVCEVDLDGDIATDTDRDIYVYSMQSEKSYCLSNNSVVDTMPILADSGKVYWYQNVNIMQASDGESAAEPVLEKTQMSSPTVFTVVTDNDGRDTILWEAGDPEAEDGSIAVYQTCQQEDGSFGNVVKCLETDGNVAYRITAAGSASDLQIAYLEGVFLEDGSLLKDLCVTTRQNVNDIMVESVTYNEEVAGAGVALPLQVAIVNTGNTTINEIAVNVNKQTITTLKDINLLPGESKEVTINGFKVPKDITSAQNFTLQAVAKGEQNIVDNQVDFLLGCSDAYMETEIRLADESTWLDINLWNNNDYEANGTLKVHKGTLDGDVIYEKAFESISAENGCSYTVNLGAYEDENVKYYVEIVTENEENNEGNNTEFVYIGYGTGVEESIEGGEVAEEITSLSLNVQNLELTIGETAQLEANSNIGKEWSGGELFWVSSDKCIASVDNNGRIKAHREGKTQITVYYGELSAICDVEVSEEKSKTFSVKFDTQGGNLIETITGITPGSTITIPENATKEGYIFKGWYTLPRGGEKISGTKIIVEESMTLYAQWMEEFVENGLWIQSIPAQTYTGKAIKPKVAVYDGKTLLQEKKDYTISYKNNVKVNDASIAKKAPTVIITGKGNYSGKETATFRIIPKEIEDSDIQVSDIIVAYNKKIQKPVPVITRDGKKLKNKTDFTVEYPDTKNGAYKETGTYKIIIKGKGGYTGERSIQLTITNNILISKASVSKIKNQTYTGSEIKPQLTIKYKGKLLKKGIDYNVSYENNKEIGTAVAVITGIGKYSGEKRVNFKITGTSISKAKVQGLVSTVIYHGEEIKQNCKLTVKVGSKTIQLKENKDYTVSYQKNQNVGTATIIFKGINGYNGTLKKKFKIKAYDIKKDTENAIRIEENISIVHAKGGSKPKPVVKFNGTVLIEGTDYKLSYKNNSTVNDGSNKKKIPTITITGKGNFKGARTVSYKIRTQDIKCLNMTVADKTYQKKKNSYKSVPKIVDLDGKVLRAGKDYDKNLEYTYAENTILDNGVIKKAGEIIGKDDILPVGTVVRVTAKGIVNYVGTISGEYRIVQADIKKASVKIPAQIYSGSEIILDKSQITVKMGKITLEDTDYEIVSYSNNIKKGTAKVVLQGVGNYGGTKTVNFKIKSKGLVWWFRNLFSN